MLFSILVSNCHCDAKFPKCTQRFRDEQRPTIVIIIIISIDVCIQPQALVIEINCTSLILYEGHFHNPFDLAVKVSFTCPYIKS